MQVALTFEESKQRTLVPKQVVGLTAALLAGAAITPMNMQAVENMAQFNTVAANQIDMDTTDKPAQISENLKIMEEKAGAQTFSCLNVSTITLIEEKKKLLETKEKIISSVLSWQGVKYRWGGRSRNGVDCSGLVQRVFLEHGIQLPRTSYEQFRQGVGVPRTKLEPGDLVFFNTNGAGASHVGVYLGQGEFISATRNRVEVESLDCPYWANTYRGSRRVLS